MQLNSGAAAHQLDPGSARQPENLSLSVFQSIAAIVEREAGIQLQASKILMVGSRLSKRLKALSINSFEDYLAFLNAADGRTEYKELINVLTTNVTAFFREQHHFDDFENAILPSLVERARSGERIRIWSAGCSIGAEPYSLALVVHKHFKDAASYDFKILATDIDHGCLNKAIAGQYPREQIDSEIPAHHRSKFRDVDDETVEVCESIKQLITVRKLNLIQAWPFKGRFATIFCRNVVIYFGADLTNQMWSQFTKYLEPEGRLYIGHSERVKGPALDHLSPVGITTYQRIGS